MKRFDADESCWGQLRPKSDSALEGVTVAEAEQSKPTSAGPAGRVEAKLELLLTVPPARPIREPWPPQSCSAILDD